MAQTPASLRSDFNRLAMLEEKQCWAHNEYYHGYLLKRVPHNCRNALDLGCGTGAFSRLLARRSAHVLGIDLSPEMIRLARKRSASLANVDYLLADALEWNWPRERFDCVVSIATLHHMPLEPILRKMAASLRPGGRLLVLDLHGWPGVLGLLANVIAIPANYVLTLKHTGRLRPPREVRAAWTLHGATDRYLPLAQIRRICRRALPGAKVKLHLFWRYSIFWTKPRK